MSTTHCLALDDAGRLITYDGTKWSTPRRLAHGIHVTQLSCATTSFCLATTSADTAYSYDGSTWTAHGEISGLSYPPEYLSCLGPDFCEAAIRGSSATYRNGTWTASGAIPGQSDYFSVLTCAATDFCLFLDSFGDVSRFDGTSWTATAPLPFKGLGDAHCLSPTYCLAVSGQDALFYDGTSWRSRIVPGVDSLLALSCLSPGRCLAVDIEGVSVALHGVRWGFPLVIPHETRFAEVRAVSCAAARMCAAVDRRGRAAFYR